MNGQLLFSESEKCHNIKVIGRATFEVAPPLREFARELGTRDFECVRLDLEKCEWMDSTFMGVISMIGVACARKGKKTFICAAGSQNTSLLLELGLRNLLTFVPETIEQLGSTAQNAAPAVPVSAMDSARTVLEAHENLIRVDEGNRDKFGVVVDMLHQDVDRLEKEEKEGSK